MIVNLRTTNLILYPIRFSFYLQHIRLNVALLNVSPPDRKGFCTLGVSVDVSLAAALNADLVIAQINPNMPRTHGTL